MKLVGVLLSLLMFLLLSCGHTMTGINWQNHVTMRTCVADPEAKESHMSLCSGYVRPQDAIGAVTDVHYVTIQLERVFFRDLPTWTHDSDVCIDVTIKGLLTGGKEYHQVLDIVHVKKEAYLQLQNVSINFPVRYENRVVSLQFSVRAVNDPATVKKLFNLGQQILNVVKSSPISGGFLGANLISEITEDIFGAISQFFTSDGHVFALKQVDFLPVANTTGTQEQLLFTEGRYLVVAVPPADAYDVLKKIFGEYPEQIDSTYLQRNATYRGGYLILKEKEANYMFSPYIVFNVAVLKRYADKSVVVEAFKSASRAMDVGNLDAAQQALAVASANFMADAGFSFKRELVKRGEISEGKGRYGLLDIGPNQILQKVEPIVEEAKKRSMVKLASPLLLGVGLISQGVGLPRETHSDQNRKEQGQQNQNETVFEEPSSGIYTELEYSLFMDFLKALNARLAMLKAGGPPNPEVLIKVLEMHLAIKLKNQEIPLFNSECEVLKRSISELWGEIRSAYNIPTTLKIQAGTELSDALKSVKPDPEKVYQTLLRLQKDTDFVLEHCLDVKSKAY